ncbi:hypothetical protein [Mucilaginibacter gynuensis]
MLKNKVLIAVGLVMAMAASSCGIFKKDCQCPHFSYQNPAKAKKAV